jgi:hypothetical protein
VSNTCLITQTKTCYCGCCRGTLCKPSCVAQDSIEDCSQCDSMYCAWYYHDKCPTLGEVGFNQAKCSTPMANSAGTHAEPLLVTMGALIKSLFSLSF